MSEENVTVSKAFLNYLYLSGYRTGHHDTVEGGYDDVDSAEWYTYFGEEVDEILHGEGDEA